MRITVFNNEVGAKEPGFVLYEGTDPVAAQAVVDAHGPELPGLCIYAGKSEYFLTGSQSVIDDEINVEDCDVLELLDIAADGDATILEIYMNSGRIPARRKVS